MDDSIPPAPDEHDDGLVDRLRDMPVGTLDPNIIGDAGPTDVPPGSDPREDEEFEVATEDADPLTGL